MALSDAPKTWPALWSVLLAGQAVRLVAMVLLPYSDTSEPRYADIARRMLSSGDWVTPFIDDGVPFWGKPPLSFWFQAAAMGLLGPGEFSARIPAWLAMVTVGYLLYRLGRACFGEASARIGLVVYGSMALPYVAAGAVLTDPFLALGVAWSLTSYFLAGVHGGRRWGYGFFAGLALGMLAKGPLGPVLTLTVICIWLFCRPSARATAASLPWKGGIALLLLLTLPWYVLAELQTPGFLHYFLIGEHFLRFMDPGWAGDLYGSAHQRTRGAIWLDWLLATLPWTPVALIGMALACRTTSGRQSLIAAGARDPVLYLLIWAGLAPVFFTLSRNILWTYVLPSLAPLALLIGHGLAQARWSQLRATLCAAGFVPLVFSGLMLHAVLLPDEWRSEKGLVQATPLRSGARLHYVGDVPFSARYYSDGKAQSTSLKELASLVDASNDTYIAVRLKDAEARQGLIRMGGTAVLRNQRHELYRIPARQSQATIIF